MNSSTGLFNMSGLLYSSESHWSFSNYIFIYFIPLIVSIMHLHVIRKHYLFNIYKYNIIFSYYINYSHIHILNINNIFRKNNILYYSKN